MLTKLLSMITPKEASTSPFYKQRQGQCSICSDNETLVNISKQCTHLAGCCAPCITQSITTDINSKGLYVFRCPLPACNVKFEPEEYYHLLDQRLISIIDNLLLHRVLETDEEFRWCKSSKGCGAGQLVSNHKHLLGYYTCHACDQMLCFRHSIEWHKGYTCDEFDKERAENNELASDVTILVHTKKCPNESCGTPIMKHEGCDVMTCCRFGTHVCGESKGDCDHGGRNYCGQRFCWVCLGKIDVDKKTSHFHTLLDVLIKKFTMTKNVQLENIELKHNGSRSMDSAVVHRSRLVLTLRMSLMSDNRPTETIVDTNVQSLNLLEVNKCEDKAIEGSIIGLIEPSCEGIRERVELLGDLLKIDKLNSISDVYDEMAQIIANMERNQRLQVGPDGECLLQLATAAKSNRNIDLYNFDNEIQRQFGLYSVEVIGDGSCAFRAILISGMKKPDRSYKELREQAIQQVLQNVLYYSTVLRPGETASEKEIEAWATSMADTYTYADELANIAVADRYHVQLVIFRAGELLTVINPRDEHVECTAFLVNVGTHYKALVSRNELNDAQKNSERLHKSSE
ncbi:unnamed protein product [Adineta ricciae]|uniref:RBR-type E3 ubiquitin transferase n=1 Tax=Adineta ricciae TaxID=249248 RepID=A0A815MFM5_ADIRI|nr:unnamed protein product [Adineta ricciae]